MSLRLTPQHLTYLRKLQQELKLQDKVNRKVGARDVTILSWCEEQCLVNFVPSRNDHFDYSQDLLVAIEQRLIQLGYAPLSDVVPKTSLEQAGHSHYEFKSSRRGPRSDRVLVTQQFEVPDALSSQVWPVR